MRGVSSVAAFSVALAASLVGVVPDASACSPPPDGWFPSGTFPAPANGAVVLRYACISGCGTLPDVEQLVLKGPGDALVPGSVVFSQARATELVIAFLPEPGALIEAASYTAELAGVPTVAGILVGPAVTWHDALTLTDEVFETDRPTGESVCCSGPIDSCGQTPCFYPQVERSTSVTVGWYDSQSIEHYQYVFRIGQGSIEPGAPWSWDAGETQFQLDPTEDSACYVLELKRLVDDSVQTFASRCVDQPQSFMPGPHMAGEEDIAAVLGTCDEPPDGYQGLWCETRREMCELSPDEPWCAGLAALCAVDGGAGAAGASSVAGSGGSAGNGGRANNGGSAGRGGSAGNGGTAGSSVSMGGRGGSSGAQGGTAGRSAVGGTSSMPSGAGGTAAEPGNPDGEAGAAGEPSTDKTVHTKGCGCSVPGAGSREPASFALALALVALQLRRTRSRVAR